MSTAWKSSNAAIQASIYFSVFLSMYVSMSIYLSSNYQSSIYLTSIYLSSHIYHLCVIIYPIGSALMDTPDLDTFESLHLHIPSFGEGINVYIFRGTPLLSQHPQI